jgi:hypothetical protein
MPESHYLKNQKNEQARPDEFQAAMDGYKHYLRDQTHPDNKTQGYEKNLFHALNKLFVAANERDKLKPGEGIFGLFALCLQSLLHIKDEVVKLRKEVRDLRLEIKRLKRTS